jgi:membrane protein implicated in regulation of membrane protease activity
MSHIKVGSYKVRIPRSKRGRQALGGALLVGGAFWWLPVLGLWMVPAGLAVLSVDSPKVRRFRRRSEVRSVRGWKERQEKARQRRTERAGQAGDV